MEVDIQDKFNSMNQEIEDIKLQNKHFNLDTMNEYDEGKDQNSISLTKE